MTNPQLIAIDWGSTNCRAYLLGKQATVLDKIDSAKGILHISPEQFEPTYHTLLKEWLKSYGNIPVIMSGMVGARQGWIEVPYISVPVAQKQLAQSLVQVPHFKSAQAPYIVPGIMIDTSFACDVIRGEETQIVGALQHNSVNTNKKIFCLPGTHSKWAYVENQKIQQFTTYMTGELFSLLSTQSILSKTISAPSECNTDALAAGLHDAHNDRGLLANLFTIRARHLRNHLAVSDAYDYLSGLLIGHEIQHALMDETNNYPITLITTESIGFRYQYALTSLKKSCQFISSESATTQGLWTIAQTATLI